MLLRRVAAALVLVALFPLLQVRLHRVSALGGRSCSRWIVRRAVFRCCSLPLSQSHLAQRRINSCGCMCLVTSVSTIPLFSWANSAVAGRAKGSWCPHKPSERVVSLVNRCASRSPRRSLPGIGRVAALVLLVCLSTRLQATGDCVGSSLHGCSPCGLIGCVHLRSALRSRSSMQNVVAILPAWPPERDWMPIWPDVVRAAATLSSCSPQQYHHLTLPLCQGR
eukprot:739100-Amphidinium_carterae.1